MFASDCCHASKTSQPSAPPACADCAGEASYALATRPGSVKARHGVRADYFGGLPLGAANDAVEADAERAAQAMTQGGSTSVSPAGGAVRRKASGAAPTGAAPGPLGAGQPLGAAERGYFEPRLGRSLADVRVHSGGEATRAAASIGAEAYTVGSHVVFGGEGYRPESASGRHLLAHELAHVAQGTSHDQVRPYRDVKSSEKAMKNYGGVDDGTAGLTEKKAPGKGDPLLDTIHVKFSGNGADLGNSGNLLVTGTLTAKYRASDKRADIVIPVTGGTTAEEPYGLTDRLKGHAVQRIEGPGYNQKSVKGADAQPAPPGEYSHYVKKTGTVGHAAFDYPSSMGMAIFFKDNKQAIHFGSPTDGSHACVHVDWDKQKTAMRLLNYHSMVGTTVVSVEYEKNAALKQVCCHPNRVKRGFVNPCDVYSEADCAGPPKKK